jgi:hypothetical protein
MLGPRVDTALGRDSEWEGRPRKSLPTGSAVPLGVDVVVRARLDKLPLLAYKAVDDSSPPGGSYGLYGRY